MNKPIRSGFGIVLKGGGVLRRILIIKPTEVLKREDYNNFVDYIDHRCDEDVLVLNKNMEYEVVEIG